MSRNIIAGGIIAVVVVAGIGIWYGLEPDGSGGADPENPEQVALGKRVYAAQCAACHGVKLEGQPNWRSRKADGTLPAPPHDQTGHTWHHADGLLFTLTKKGGQAVAPPGFTSAMPGYGEILTDGEIWAVLAYIKSRWPQNILIRQASINERARKANN